MFLFSSRALQLYATQELQVTSDSRRHLLSLVIVTSLHKANKNTRGTSTITCCGLPRGERGRQYGPADAREGSVPFG